MWLNINRLDYLHPMARKRKKPKIVDHFLREWREYRGLSQERLAARIEATAGLISQIETGKTKLTEERLGLLAIALQCDPGDILSRDPNGPDYQLWRIIKGLPPQEQEQALRIIKALTQKVA